MNLPIYQVDAFASEVFKGNPAAVVPLEDWLSNEYLQAIAAENNLSETAFFVKIHEEYHLRWFTPTVEVDLCGHATLATAHVLYEHLGYQGKHLVFNTRVGKLTVSKKDGLYTMNFPTDELKVDDLNALTVGKNPIVIKECFKGRDDYLLILENQSAVEQFEPNLNAMKKLPARGFIVSARGNQVDFVSRGFFPAAGVDEDPVTGSAHTTLTPYWYAIFEKKDMVAQQLSKRGGTVYCKYLNDRVEIAGHAITYLMGEIYIKK